MNKVLIIVGDATETVDTLYPYYRLQEDNFLPIVAERMSFFMDGRFTYLGDRYFPDDNQTRGDLNYFTARAGFRFTY